MGPGKKLSPISSDKTIKQNINLSAFLKPQAARNKTGGSDNEKKNAANSTHYAHFRALSVWSVVGALKVRVFEAVPKARIRKRATDSPGMHLMPGLHASPGAAMHTPRAETL